LTKALHVSAFQEPLHIQVPFHAYLAVQTNGTEPVLAGSGVGVRAAGMRCVVLNGVNKSAAYQLGRPVDRRAMLAQWNAVHVDGDWRLLDVFWASTCLVGRHSADWALLDSDGQLVDNDDAPVCCACLVCVFHLQFCVYFSGGWHGGMRYVMYTSGFMNDVIFSHNGPCESMSSCAG